MNALGGENEFAKILSHPNEFAFASLNSSLSYMGLSINTTEDIKKQARETDFLDVNRGFVINIDNQKQFKEFLNDKPIMSDNHCSATSGPIKDIKSNHPSETGFGSFTSYEYKYDNINCSKMEVWIKPSEYVSMMKGKIKDIKSFTLKFESSGEAEVIKRYARRTGVDRSHDGKEAVNGLNHIKVMF